MKTSRTILQAVALLVIAAFMLVVGLASAGNATESGYTTGEETYDFGPPVNADDPEGPKVGWGPIPDTPHFEDIDGVSNVCIDPPEPVIVTIHVLDNGTEVNSAVFPYERLEAGYACGPLDPPVCPDDTQDHTFDLYGTWNIGSGQSGHLTIELDCTPEVVPEPPAVPPVELAPPVVETAVPVEGETPAPAGTLPVTGSNGVLALLGAAVAVVGFAMTRTSKAKRGLNV